MNVYLDVLPIDGKLHVREGAERRDGVEAGRQAASAEEGTPLFGQATQAGTAEVSS